METIVLDFFTNSRTIRNDGRKYAPYLREKIMNINPTGDPDASTLLIYKNTKYLTDKDLKPLIKGGFLSNNIIDFYLKEVTEVADPQPICADIIEGWRLEESRNISEGLMNVIRNSTKERVILFPLLKNKHFSLLECDRVAKEFRFYDSISDEDRTSFAKNISKKVEETLNDIDFNVFQQWNFIVPQVTQQMGKTNCGVHVLLHGKLVNNREDRSVMECFQPENVKIFRNNLIEMSLISRYWADVPEKLTRILDPDKNPILVEMMDIDPPIVFMDVPFPDVPVDVVDLPLTEEHLLPGDVVDLLPVPPLNEESIQPVPVDIGENIIQIKILEGDHDLNTDTQKGIQGEPDLHVNHSWKNSNNLRELLKHFPTKTKMIATLKKEYLIMERWLENGFDFLNGTNRRKFQRYLREAKSKRESFGTSLEDIVRKIILESGGIIKKKPKRCKKCTQHKKNKNRKM